jgi:hypothetical protein
LINIDSSENPFSFPLKKRKKIAAGYELIKKNDT